MSVLPLFEHLHTSASHISLVYRIITFFFSFLRVELLFLCFSSSIYGWLELLWLELLHSGHFWEGRFKSQALLNEQAVIACMAYVDLNPIRADICASLEDSEYTSVKQRIDEISSKPKSSHTPPIKLVQFIGASLTEEGISFSLKDYLELTDWTGRSIRADKSGYIKADTPKILAQLGIDEAIWTETVHSFSADFHTFIGPEEQLQTLCQKQKKKWLRGLHLCRKLFKSKNFCPVPI